MTITEKDIEKLVRDDRWMMKVLEAAATLGLPDWWIGAGFLRNKVWDVIEGNASVESRDVDLVYYDATNVAAEVDWAYDEKMFHEFSFAEWEVRNQARMHYVGGFDQASSTEDSIARWSETATCIGVKICDNKLEFLYCHGSEDLLNLIARPVSEFQNPEKMKVFYDRIEKKGWRERWPNLRVLDS